MVTCYCYCYNTTAATDTSAITLNITAIPTASTLTAANVTTITTMAKCIHGKIQGNIVEKNLN